MKLQKTKLVLEKIVRNYLPRAYFDLDSFPLMLSRRHYRRDRNAENLRTQERQICNQTYCERPSINLDNSPQCNSNCLVYMFDHCQILDYRPPIDFP